MNRMRGTPVGSLAEVVTSLGNLSKELRPFVAERSTEICRLEHVGSLSGGFVVSQRHGLPPVVALHLDAEKRRLRISCIAALWRG
jgi:hypothetical protein